MNQLVAYHEIVKEPDRIAEAAAGENCMIEVLSVGGLSCHHSWKQVKHVLEHPYFQVCAFQEQGEEGLLMVGTHELQLVSQRICREEIEEQDGEDQVQLDNQEAAFEDLLSWVVVA